MSITIQLDGKDLAALQQQAVSAGVPVEQLAEAIIHRHLESKSTNDPAFRKAMEDTFRENAELYRRLAK